MATIQPTRLRLIEAAIRLFAEQGVEGVSLRAAAEAAGARNTAAVHYHFGDREGLLAACIDHIIAAMRTPLAPLPRVSGDPLADILGETFWPLIALDACEPVWGRHAQRLLARIVMGEGVGLGARFEALTEADAEALALRIVEQVPDIEAAGLRARIDLAALLVIAGLSASGTAVDHGESDKSEDAIALLQFCVAGIRNGAR